MAVGANQSTICAYTIPVDHTGYLVKYRATAIDQTSSRAVFSVQSWELGEVFRQRRVFGIVSGGFHDTDLYGGIRLPELTDIKMRCVSASANNMDLTASFDTIVVRNV